MRAIAILAAISMVVGLFLPWLNPQVAGIGFTPWNVIKELDPSVETAQDLAQNTPEMLAFLSTFAVAALFVALAVLGPASRPLALVAGGGAVAMIIYGLVQMGDRLSAIRLPKPTADNLAEIAQSLPNLLGMGAWAWLCGAVILLMTALIGFPSRH